MFFFPSFWDSDDMNVGAFLLSHWPLRFCSFFLHVFSLVFRMDHSYWLVFQFTHSFICHLQSTSDSICDIFISMIIFFSSKTSIWSFFIPSISSLRLSNLSICFQSICPYFLNHGFLKYFSNNANICVISTLVSVDWLLTYKFAFPCFLGGGIN